MDRLAAGRGSIIYRSKEGTVSLSSAVLSLLCRLYCSPSLFPCGEGIFLRVLVWFAQALYQPFHHVDHQHAIGIAQGGQQAAQVLGLIL